MNVPRFTSRILFAIFVGVLFHVTVLGEPVEPQESSASEPKSVELPGESLEKMILDRRNELTRQHNDLRETIANLGDNHPSVASLREQAKQTMMQREFWSSPPEKLLSLSGREMRALVLQLVVRVDRLESEQRSLQSQRPRASGSMNARSMDARSIFSAGQPN